MTSDAFATHSSPSTTTTPIKRHWSGQSQLPSPPASSSHKFAKFSHTSEPGSISEFPSQSDSFNEGTQSEVYFPLSVTPEKDCKTGIITDTSADAMLTDSELQSSAHYLGTMPGTPSSGTSDSNQGPPVPTSGPVASTGMPSMSSMSPGGTTQEGADGKVGISLEISGLVLDLIESLASCGNQLERCWNH
jgi:hypothetical protein